MSSKISRHAYILNLLQRAGEINVTELAQALSISQATIRKDLAILEQEGQLVRIHGGARLTMDNDFSSAQNPSRLSKLQVAKEAAHLIKNGEIIFLGSGTTCLEIAKCIKQTHQNLTIVSNNLTVLSELSGTPTFTILGTGGQIESFEHFSVFHGDFVIQFLEKILVQKAFLTADGVSLKNGYTTHNRNEYHLYESIRNISEHMIFAVEGWKFNKNSILRLADMDSISTIVSDPSIPKEYIAFYQQSGKRLYIGEEN